MSGPGEMGAGGQAGGQAGGASRGAAATAALTGDGGHPKPDELLEQWLRGIKIEHVGHTRAASVYARRNRYLGAAATLLSTVVGSTLFASLSSSDKTQIVTVAAIISVFTIVLTALSTFLNYSELVTSHRAAANAYAGLRRRVEQLHVFGEPDKLRDEMAGIADTWTKTEQDNVDLPSNFYEYGYKWVHSQKRVGLLGQE